MYNHLKILEAHTYPVGFFLNKFIHIAIQGSKKE